MRSGWIEDDLVAEWLLQPGERELLRERRGATRLGFALQLKFFQIEGRFPAGPDELPSRVIQFMATQLEIYLSRSQHSHDGCIIRGGEITMSA